jgi:hypothetical protein
MNKNKEEAASRHRTRAKQLRALAEQIENEKDRKLLLAVADEYDQLAQTAGGGVMES